MKIPVLLVTGFLGSGKTTFLQELARRFPEKRMLFLVNEFADSGFDDQQLGRSGIPTESVIGGSLFCHCKAGEFIRVLRERVIPLHHQSPFDAVIIETSGIADPGAIGTVLHDYGLHKDLIIRQILAVLAPKNLPKLIRNLPVTTAQIRTSHLVVLNKTDLASPAQITAARQHIASINPDAQVMESSFCSFPYAFPDEAPELAREPLSTADANPYATRVLHPSSPVPLPRLRSWLESLPAFVLRAKGLLPTDKGWFVLQHSLDESVLQPVDPPDQEPSVVLIAHESDEEQLLQITLPA